jgi:uracil-DNA glycosylase
VRLACDKCAKHGLGFYATHISPADYIEGRHDADVWIIGLNPKGDIGVEEKRTIQDFDNFSPSSHSYFKDFSKVSRKLYDNFNSANSRVAHTDLIKCFSPSFPPVVQQNGQQKIPNVELVIKNCIEHLMEQLRRHTPKIIICNGSPVSREILKVFPPPATENWNTITSYQADLPGTDHKFWIVLSGFIGRIDDRNKRRLGMEIEQILTQEKIEL